MPTAASADYRTEQINFVSERARLEGTLVFPKSEALAAVIFVHGSGPQTRNMPLAEAFAQTGIAALVYDKRGVGKSEGEFESKQPVSEKNLTLLAKDAAAALHTLASHPKLSGVPLGITGISQAGWIVPLAAQESGSADFIVLWSSPVTRVSEEDIYSKHTNDQDTDNPPTFEAALDARLLPYFWPPFLGKDTDPTESLAKLDVPGLWIFGSRDGSIPVDLSMQRLKRLTERGHAFDIILVPGTGHNNMPETFSLAVDWIKKNLSEAHIIPEDEYQDRR